jgi:hypothetical protein
VSPVSRWVERLDVTFDDETLVANAGLIMPATLMVRLGLEALANATVRLGGRVGGARPGRKAMTLVATILACGTDIDHAHVVRAGATQRVLPFRVMAARTPWCAVTLDTEVVGVCAAARRDSFVTEARQSMCVAVDIVGAGG